MSFDLVIRGGTVVDGTGLARRRADVGIAAGRIAAVGHLSGGIGDAQVIDAEGQIVAPGIIDLHTHYDPQLTFDPYATSSCYHGVTTVLAGNCGFSIAPTHEAARPYTKALFAKVEGMSPAALEGVRWEFQSFPEYLAARRGQLGVNLACYVGHSAVRRHVMGVAGSEREATAEELAEMCALVQGAIAAGAAGFSSSDVPTQVDGDDRPIPSRFGSREELEALVETAGRAGAGSVAYLPESVIGGVNAEDEALLIRLGRAARVPIVLQGIGGRDKVDAPTAGWDHAREFLDSAAAQGAAVFSILRTHPFDRPIDLAAGCPLYAGVPSWAALMDLPHREKLERLRDPAYRDRMRGAVESPNRDPKAGSTLPPPQWHVTFVEEVRRPEHEAYVGRSIAEIAAEREVAPADAMLDLALAEDLGTRFRWQNRTPEWERAVRESMKHPSMLMGISDGGAHLDRDDGSDWSSFFLRYWVLDRGEWSLEEGIRQLTQVPAAVAGLSGRGTLLPGQAADIMIFDPQQIGPGTKRMVHDLPGGEGRFCALPKGIGATIVNGAPIVRDGKLTRALPGQVLRPFAANA
ncbi:MAG: amidohydrolase family protein [Proteobacteria bacterium]|nr:amidohydrolase family protein [Pseudomonadota bacterium]